MDTLRTLQRSAVTLGILALLGTPANAGDTRRYAIEGDQLFLAVQVGLGKHQLSVVSRALDGTVVLGPEGGRVKLSVPLASFESGNRLADAVLQKALEAEQFPVVEFEGTTTGHDGNVTFAGTLSLHGVSEKVSVPVRFGREGEAVFATVLLVLDLDRFGLELPKVGGAQLESRVELQLAARLHPLAAVASK